jgi:hypothetical protein
VSGAAAVTVDGRDSPRLQRDHPLAIRSQAPECAASKPGLQGHITCRVFQDAKPALKGYTLRRRKEIFDWINEPTRTPIHVWAAHTHRQAQTARRLAVETWLQENGAITITQNTKVLLVFLQKFAHSYVASTGSKFRHLTRRPVSTPETWQELGNVKPRKPCKTVRQGAGKYKANQQDRNLRPDSGSAYRGSNPCLPAISS